MTFPFLFHGRVQADVDLPLRKRASPSRLADCADLFPLVIESRSPESPVRRLRVDRLRLLGETPEWCA
jgi:hypothetical protein